MVAQAGMPPLRFLSSPDEFEVLVMQQVAREVADAADRRDDQLAIRIANAVGKRLGV